MPSIVITPGQDGKLRGVSDMDKRHFRRFQKRCRELAPGDTMAFSYKPPRSPVLHRRYFFILRWIWRNQEVFQDERLFRKWAEMGAGHCDYIPGPDGAPQAIPKTIAYEDVDDDDFKELFTGVMNFIRSSRGVRTLWPHANPDDAWVAVDNIIESHK